MIDIRLRADTAPLRLLADRALYWQAQDCLVLADVHLGKGDVFRRQGLAVPAGASVSDLSRIDALLAACGARSWLPTTSHTSSSVWRARHTELDVWLVVGNHDRAPQAASSASMRLRSLTLAPAGTARPWRRKTSPLPRCTSASTRQSCACQYSARSASSRSGAVSARSRMSIMPRPPALPGPGPRGPGARRATRWTAAGAATRHTAERRRASAAPAS